MSRIKTMFGCLIKFLISVALGFFAVALIGHALHGDPYAIGLAIFEFLIVAFPYWADGKMIPKWLDTLHTYSIPVWFVIAIIWVLYIIGVMPTMFI